MLNEATLALCVAAIKRRISEYENSPDKQQPEGETTQSYLEYIFRNLPENYRRPAYTVAMTGLLPPELREKCQAPEEEDEDFFIGSPVRSRICKTNIAKIHPVNMTAIAVLPYTDFIHNNPQRERYPTYGELAAAGHTEQQGARPVHKRRSTKKSRGT